MVKNLLANAKDVRNAGLIPGLGTSLGEGMVTLSSILSWRIPQREESGRLGSRVTNSQTWLKQLRKHSQGKIYKKGKVWNDVRIKGSVCESRASPRGSDSKESSCNAGDLGSILALGRYPEEGNDYSLQYSGLENSMDCIVHGVTK